MVWPVCLVFLDLVVLVDPVFLALWGVRGTRFSEYVGVLGTLFGDMLVSWRGLGTCLVFWGVYWPKPGSWQHALGPLCRPFWEPF